MKIRKILLWALLAATASSTCIAQNKILIGDVRPRPPEMIIDEKTGAVSGPLLDVFTEAAKSVGYEVNWQVTPFPRSMKQLETGESDIVPRLLVTDERKLIAEFLGPIGVQPTDIEFLVRAGREHELKSYDDLKKMTVGTKRKTVYFERFDKDKSIRRMEALDDENLARMLDTGRFDAMIVLDRPAIEKVLKANNITNYAVADYKVPMKLGIYFGMSKASKHIGAAGALSDALRKMTKSGRLAEIYKKHNATPPQAD